MVNKLAGLVSLLMLFSGVASLDIYALKGDKKVDVISNSQVAALFEQQDESQQQTCKSLKQMIKYKNEGEGDITQTFYLGASEGAEAKAETVSVEVGTSETIRLS